MDAITFVLIARFLLPGDEVVTGLLLPWLSRPGRQLLKAEKKSFCFGKDAEKMGIREEKDLL